MSFPRNEELGYDSFYFNSLLSEKLVLSKTKTGNKFVWEKIPGHQRNEALDCRNYANAAFRVWNPDLNAICQKLKTPVVKPVKPLARPKRKRTSHTDYDW